MSTRGVYGFRINKKDKLTFINFDAHPNVVGLDVANFVAKTPKRLLKKLAQQTSLVSFESLQEKSLAVQKATQNWLADTDGTLNEPLADVVLASLKRGRRYLENSNSFIHKSLYCEWAYVINIDTQEFEIYRGFQMELGDGRYNSVFPPCAYKQTGFHDHTGCKLVYAIPLDALRNMAAYQLSHLFRAIEGALRTPDEDDEPDTPTPDMNVQAVEFLVQKALGSPASTEEFLHHKNIHQNKGNAAVSSYAEGPAMLELLREVSMPTN